MNKLFSGLIASLLLLTAVSCTQSSNFRVLYWNIQNGMWDGQTDNYDRFVAWIQEQNPDVCVFCEAATLYTTGTDYYLWRPDDEHYFPEHWPEVARRYGHEYVFLGGWRDDYPQVITSRYPIEGIALTGSADTVVSHGAGWAKIQFKDKVLNLVSLHLWPQKYGPDVDKEDRPRSADAREGDYYRREEIEYICSHTIKTVPPEDAAGQYWMMMGDFNSLSRVDNGVYQLPEDDSIFLVHDYIRDSTPYHDVVHERHPEEFFTTIAYDYRIDFFYCTRPHLDRIVSDRIVSDEYSTPVRDSQGLYFMHPSDHRPIVVDLAL